MRKKYKDNLDDEDEYKNNIGRKWYKIKMRKDEKKKK